MNETPDVVSREYDILLVGVGGQGVLTIADLMATAALRSGIPVNFYPSKGMAQRGGFVKAQVRLGRETAGPNIPEHGADLVIALELSESLRAVRYVRPGGDFVLYADVWQPTAVMLGRAAYPTVEQVREQVAAAGARLIYSDPTQLPTYEGAPAPDNVYVLALALGQTRLHEILSPDCVQDVIANRWRRGAARNLFSFQAGLSASQPRDTYRKGSEV
jgi:indolepyruvate ferredoxin oxidoreductase beta subunit